MFVASATLFSILSILGFVVSQYLYPLSTGQIALLSLGLTVILRFVFGKS